MITLLQGDCLTVLTTLADQSVQTIVTSPPYYGLRKYSDDPREIGQEAAPDCLAWARREPPCGPGACYVCALRAVFAQLWRVLRDDGTAWLNLGDSYATTRNDHDCLKSGALGFKGRTGGDLPEKNLMLIPARVALALQADGWILRSDVIWSKPNPMPESVTDRPTRAHEYVFLLSKKPRYYYDAQAIAEAVTGHSPGTRGASLDHKLPPETTNGRNGSTLKDADRTSRNKRSVWHISTQSYPGSHFATMPEALTEPCILAGSSAQACETCGAAWRRVVERETMPRPTSGPNRGGASHSHAALKGYSETSALRAATMSVSTTLGFTPGCACAVNTGSARSVVLDPFAGSGTVLRVAERFQRDAIGIDLNADYIDLQEKRTDKVQVEMFV